MSFFAVLTIITAVTIIASILVITTIIVARTIVLMLLYMRPLLLRLSLAPEVPQSGAPAASGCKAGEPQGPWQRRTLNPWQRHRLGF